MKTNNPNTMNIIAQYVGVTIPAAINVLEMSNIEPTPKLLPIDEENNVETLFPKIPITYKGFNQHDQCSNE